MLKNIKIGSRLAFGFSLLILFMIVLIFISIRQIKEDKYNLARINEVDMRIQLANNMIGNAKDVALSVRGFLLRKYSNSPEEQIQKMRDEYKAKWLAFDQNIEKVEKLMVQECPVGHQLFLNIQVSGDTARQLTTKAIEMALTNKVKDATSFVFSTAYPSVQRWMRNNQAFILHSEEHKRIIYTEAYTGQERARTTLYVIGILVITFSVLIVIFLTLGITNSLNLTVNAAKRIASGDLTIDTSAFEQRNDEVGLLNLAFSQMVEKLRSSLKDIIEGVNLLGSSASEILAATTQVASGSAETASAITETSTTVEEVRQAAQLSSQKASRVSENAQQVVQITQIGQKAVDETLAGMHEIQTQMESVANTIVRLSEQSQQIGGIIASVTDVADQSNLLAVNAAIEAAKAGEQGKGFAVVAQEIKSLAQQSKQATIRVRNILTDVQKATSAAVMATEQTSKAVENGVKQSTQAGDAIKKLAESSTKAVEAATQIVASSQQQTVGMDQIGLAMQNINQAGTENAASMVQAEKAAKGLNELGQKLKVLVEQYKI
jgi:methyl-accepting chemotaxis protein